MLPYNIDLTGKTVFLTGVAGFIGSNLAKQLLKTVSNIHIVGIDSMNDYYDVRLKEAGSLASNASSAPAKPTGSFLCPYTESVSTRLVKHRPSKSVFMNRISASMQAGFPAA